MPTWARLLTVVTAGLLTSALSAHAANDPGWADQWNMRIVGAETAWATGTGKGITIAVVDSGVHFGQEDLSAKLLPGQDFVQPNTPPQDDYGHGTHVAGIAAASANNGRGVVGVAPDATILPIKVLDSRGRGAANIDEGIKWAVDNGAHIVNLSLGSVLEPISGPSFTEAIRYAWDRGVICVVSTGNEFVTSSGFADENAIVVTATDRNDRRASYASVVGGAQWGMAAPGGAGGLSESNDVFSTYWTPSNKPNEYMWLAGTSMAAPHVAGAAAVLRSLGLTPLQTVERLLATAKDLGDPGRDDEYGHGRLDVAKAVAGLRTAGGGSGPGLGSGGGGTGGGGGAGAGTSSTTTTTRSAQSRGGPGVSVVAGPSKGTSTTAPGPGGAGIEEPTVASLDPLEDDAVSPDDVGAAQELDDDDRANGDETVWPLAVAALAALMGAGWAAARLRRLRV